VLSGGFWMTLENGKLIRSQPTSTGDGWYVAFHNSQLFGDIYLQAWAICATV
jgi:hypothetical protein